MNVTSVRTMKKFWDLLRRVWSAADQDNVSSMSAALAFYTLFSIAPLLLIVITVAGLVFGADVARQEIIGQLSDLAGAEGALAISGLLSSVSVRPAAGLTTAAISLVLLIVGATTVFAELQNSLDRIWRAPSLSRQRGMWDLVRSRLMSFAMILCIACLLMVSMIISAALGALGQFWGKQFLYWATWLQIANLIANSLVVACMFALIYKILPNVAIRWGDVWGGALLTALLFHLGQFLIGLYIGRSGVTSSFGAAASIVVLLIWVYYSAQIFLLGAEFSCAYAHTYGSRRAAGT